MTIRVGCIGTGVMGAEHARLLQDEISGATLSAVSDIDRERAANIAKDAAIYTDAHELIASPDIDAVVIASPDATHAEYTRAAIALGKAVLCEKPLATDANEAWSIVEAEMASGKACVSVGFMRRFDSAYVELYQLLKSGNIGKAVLLHNIHRNTAAPDWFSGPMAITNSFVHEIDITRYLLGEELKTVEASSGPTGDPLLITMQTTGGILVSTEVFMNASYGYDVRAEIVGQRGSVSLAPFNRVNLNLDGVAKFGYPENWVPRFADAYRRQMQCWVDATQRTKTVGASAWDGYLTTTIAEQTVSALESGQRQTLVIPPKPEFYKIA